ncbi:hypothetical protein ABZ805_14300 [Saccharopolyspora sp. NPDC047091]|uniref:hypothetical protein n=1 Tax=Saccharopolyspora sp. NPDC047091 TaxID=3155924 RepID=UPI0033C84B20
MGVRLGAERGAPPVPACCDGGSCCAAVSEDGGILSLRDAFLLHDPEPDRRARRSGRFRRVRALLRR